jgi:hypothetical protein
VRDGACTARGEGKISSVKFSTQCLFVVWQRRFEEGGVTVVVIPNFEINFEGRHR